jgi:hypothetical protein
MIALRSLKVEKRSPSSPSVIRSVQIFHLRAFKQGSHLYSNMKRSPRKERLRFVPMTIVKRGLLVAPDELHTRDV